MHMTAAHMTVLSLLRMLCMVDTISNRWQRNATYMRLVVSGCLKLLKNSLLSDQAASRACAAGRHQHSQLHNDALAAPGGKEGAH